MEEKGGVRGAQTQGLELSAHHGMFWGVTDQLRETMADSRDVLSKSSSLGTQMLLKLCPANSGPNLG